MNCYPEYGAAPRRKSRQVRVGHVAIGGEAPIVVQSMTNTDTADVAATVRQVADLARAGSEIVRVTVNNTEAAAAVPAIRERLDAMGISAPLVGDFHFNGHRLLTSTRHARKRWRSCASTRAMSAAAPSAMSSSRP